MTPCIVTIRGGKKRRRFFFLTGSFSIGIGNDDDLIICDPAFSDESISVVDGKVVHGPFDTENGTIHITCLKLRFLLPTAIVLAALLFAGPFLSRNALSSQARHDLTTQPSGRITPARPRGARDVRVTAGLPKAKEGDATGRRMANIRSVLDDPMAGGREISRYYLMLRSGLPGGGDVDSAKQMESIRATVEGRMQILLRRAVIKSRSLIASGQISMAMDEMDRLKDWVPAAWVYGRKELDEAEGMFY
ncbi:MAG TPA: hypothetical protein ENH32_07325 [Proteobacteria bacterium]|nr:hypothetical protein [Pseudomonadota bacterium]